MDLLQKKTILIFVIEINRMSTIYYINKNKCNIIKKHPFSSLVLSSNHLKKLSCFLVGYYVFILDLEKKTQILQMPSTE